MKTIEADYRSLFAQARQATAVPGTLDTDTITKVLNTLADTIEARTSFLLEANQLDLDRMSPEDSRYDRLRLTPERIAGIAADIRNVAGLPSPLGTVLAEKTLPNGLHLSRVTVPLGVIGIIYEARPNVTLDTFALCFKTGNVAILKGGSDAAFSNEAILTLVHEVLAQYGIAAGVVTLLPPERAAAEALLHATGFVDVVIPRGSQQLIDWVRREARVPVIETGAGIVHTYFDESASLEKASRIVLNAKTRRVSVCNALDCLIVHANRLSDLPQLVQPLAAKQVELYVDEAAWQVLEGKYPAALLYHAEEQHYGTEFLSLRMAVKTVPDFDAALAHIHRYSSKHSEAILSENKNNIERFLQQVDAAAVYVNASTAFTDGAQFGLGAEIGISTQKLHARGPMALEALTSYKWLVRGDGQVREP
jgi:glutamate-5-semialdehyde dehydrogenase